MTSDPTIIIGGGVIGAATAYYLAKSGREVTIIEGGEFGRGCSHANCGLVSPSHVLPLAEPGAVGKTLRMMLRPNSPVSVKPRFDPGLWKWLAAFARQCKPDLMLRAALAIDPLLQRSREMYEELIDNELTDCEWQTDGALFVYKSSEPFEKFAKADKLIQEQVGLAAQRLSEKELLELEPSLKPGLAGGWRYEIDAHLRPDKLMMAWRKTLNQLGVKFVENTTVTNLAVEGDVAESVETTGGNFDAAHVVVAAGYRTPEFARQLGGKIPIQPGKGYSLTMDRPAICPKVAVHFVEHKVVATPFASGYRLGSMMQFNGSDTRLDRKRIELLKNVAGLYLHEPTHEKVQEEWTGLRPMMYDGVPLIGRSVKLRNTYIAGGHGMLGLSMAPATGRLISEMINDVEPFIDAKPYSPKRFA